MTNKGVLDDKTIYVAFNDIFKGHEAGFRRQSPVQKVIRTHQNRPEISRLINSYGLPTVLEKVRTLLAEGVFESTLRAKTKFPELFQVSPAQSAERAASEAAAAAHQAQSLEQAVEEESFSDGDDDDAGHDSGIENASFDWGSQTLKQPARDLTEVQTSEAAVQAPSLFPMYLPFATGHRILRETQSTLEAACFRFASEHAPEILNRRGWDCPEATELNVIARKLTKHRNSLDILEATPLKLEEETGGASSPSRDLGALTRSITQLRHTAVHRGRITAKVLEQFLLDAECFATRLGDRAATAAVSRARREVQKNVTELENNKSMLEAKLRRSLDDIAARRAELDRLERTSIEDMLRADAEYQAIIGASLEEALSQTQTQSSSEAGSDLGDAASEDAHSLAAAEGSVAGCGDVDELQNGLQDGCDSECDSEEEESFEDALESDIGTFLVTDVPSIEV